MHVVSASRRTDLPACHTPWFMARVRAGECLVPNPLTGRPYLVSLRPKDVLAIVFWTRNAEPLLRHLAELSDRGLRHYFQYTLTPYGPPMERHVPPTEANLDTMARLLEHLGPDLLVWRFDPLVETSARPWPWLLEQFGRLAAVMRGLTRRCVTSFYQPYPAATARLERLAASQGWTYRYQPISRPLRPSPHRGQPYTLDEQLSRVSEMVAVAHAHGLELQVCCAPELCGDQTGATSAACIDAELVALARGEPVALPAAPSRPGCGCVSSRDIGTYDSCAHGCVYCYAMRRAAYVRGADPTQPARAKQDSPPSI